MDGRPSAELGRRRHWATSMKRRISECDRVARASGAHGRVLSGGGAVGDLSGMAMARA
jgi:hypothetical protein